MRKRCFFAGRRTMRRSFSRCFSTPRSFDEVDVGTENAEGLAGDNWLRRGIPEIERHLDVVVLTDDITSRLELRGRGQGGEGNERGGGDDGTTETKHQHGIRPLSWNDGSWPDAEGEAPPSVDMGTIGRV